MVRSPRGCLTQQVGAVRCDPMFKGPSVLPPGSWGHPSPNILFRPAPHKRSFRVGAGGSTPCNCCWRGSKSSRDGPGCWRAVGGGQRAEEAPPPAVTLSCCSGPEQWARVPCPFAALCARDATWRGQLLVSQEALDVQGGDVQQPGRSCCVPAPELGLWEPAVLGNLLWVGHPLPPGARTQ